ncbi:MAG: alpha-glucosidase, partial [Candidatus Eremiobacteraeota bacterium]|nr:alpha-glucosidase [Candidatus Eremiobacteraeota bacterium]
MKFVERLTRLETGPRGLIGQLDGSHQLAVEALTPTIVRVLIRKNGQLRLDRTWSIACGRESVPWEGLSRLELPTAAFDREDHDLVTGPVRLRIHPDPYQLEWFYLGKSVLKERSTGSLAFGRRDHRLWHFHQLRPESRFYGLGERSGELDRRGRRFEMRNVDPMGYDARTTDPLYKHFPFYLEQNDTGCFGLFYDNFANCFFDLGQEIDNYHGPFTSYRAADGDFDLYFLASDNLLEVTRSFCWLTGRTYLPPKWSLGYSTTSMHYTDHPQAQRRIEQFLDEAEAHQLELATFKYGSGYTTRDDKRYVFTWNDQKFPDPKALNARFHERGVRLAANVKPVLLADHPAYDQVRPLFVQDSEVDGPEVSQFWDNRGSHLDFSNPDTVAWWQRQAQAQVLEYGFDALWNDNNEYVIWDDEARCHGFGKPFPIGLVRPLMSQWMTRASHEVTQA